MTSSARHDGNFVLLLTALFPTFAIDIISIVVASLVGSGVSGRRKIQPTTTLATLLNLKYCHLLPEVLSLCSVVVSVWLGPLFGSHDLQSRLVCWLS